MRVYRLEHAVDGSGPFSDMDALYDHDDFDYWRYEHMGSVSHPGPARDGIKMLGSWANPVLDKDRLFGCPSKEMIDFWFEPGYNMFKSAGFVINVYEVHGNAVKKGHSGTQVVFNRNKATLVETIEIP